MQKEMIAIQSQLRSDVGGRPESGVGARNRPQRDGRQLDDLEAALAECRSAAREGYRVALNSLENTDAAIEHVSRALKRSMRDIEGGRAQTSAIVEQLREQLRRVVSELYELQKSSRASLDARRENLDDFSIALFGRTMAGKSTLMEILTDGDGQRIGKGAQRTTRDVREYHWRGLKVTDVPGVAAFEGAEDEDLAFKAAAEADLVLFLITDDAPQPVEAECLARVRALGKPVLGICNVKVALEDEDDVFLFLRNPAKYFDMQRLGALVGQFHEFADLYIPGYRIWFVYAHLRSRYLSQQEAYPERGGELARASRFDMVERSVIGEIVGRGKFLRVKSFIDGAVAPLLELGDRLLEFSAQNSSSGRVLVAKRRQALSWARRFRISGQERIDIVIAKHVEFLRAEIPSFAEDNYDREDAGERWSIFVERQGLQRQAEKLQEELQEECRVALVEIARELQTELKLVAELTGDRRIAMNSVFDGKRVWNWGTTILSGGLGLAAMILGSGPLGWATVALTAVGWAVSLFFDDREVKVRRQRQKLAERLHKNIDTIEGSLRQGLGDWFHRGLLRDQVDMLIDDLNTITAGLFQLADAQRTLAWTLNREQKKLHRALLREALEQLGRPELDSLALAIARIPGVAMMILISPRTRFPGEVRSALESLLGERIWFVVSTGSRLSTLSQAIGKDCDPGTVSIEEKIQVAHVPVGALDAVGLLRIRLAQQLTELHVMK